MKPCGAALIVTAPNYQGHLGLSVETVENEAIAGVRTNTPGTLFHSPCTLPGEISTRLGTIANARTHTDHVIFMFLKTCKEIQYCCQLCYSLINKAFRRENDSWKWANYNCRVNHVLALILY